MQHSVEGREGPNWIGYAEFGERFVEHAVTEQRIIAAVSGMVGQGVTVGPVNLAPAGIAGFLAEGKVGTPRVSRHDEAVVFHVSVPVTLAVKVLLGGKTLRLEALVDIDLTLHARTAEPVLIVIDIPPIAPENVGFLVRASAVDAAWESLLEPIAGWVKREVAQRVNAMLAEPQARRARIFDLEALVDGRRARGPVPERFEWIDYGEFGRRFFERIVTTRRIGEVVDRMAGRPIEIGPLRTGPGDRATVTVRGAIGTPLLAAREPAEPHDGYHRFELVLPVALDITVRVLRANRYRAEVEIPLLLTARAAEPLWVVIDPFPPRPEDLRLQFKAEGMRAAAFGALAGIKKQMLARVLGVVKREISRAEGRIIDVGARIDRLV
ncbi:hypothetical protein [Nocardia shimofusensis]|uniref:hypothetical protein n=1 Tax=Nocardia shimofusensis TaxID=228596 RepID=UPI00082C4AF5|nr:hypothetical protein [Nocardia shimofusensis]